MKMKFGKYRGHDICFINSGYLKWLLDQDWFLKRDESEILAIEKELKLRDMDSSHFYQDKISVK
jgi:uncharacterized protein (DUF3820 family)